MIQYLIENGKLQFYHVGCYVRIVGGETFQAVGRHALLPDPLQ